MNQYLILRFMRWLNKLYLKYEKSESRINPKAFDRLTPYIEEDAESHYSDSSTQALEKALHDPAIKNIAITGSFGAGKSSFLYTFEYHHKWLNYINISLATFEEGNGDDEARTKTNQLIEKSILQQLLYKVKKDQIPHSQFNRIQKIYFLTALRPIFIFLIWLVSYIIIFHKEVAKKLLQFQSINIPEMCYSLLGGTPCNYIVLVSFLTTSLILIWKVYKYLSSFRVTKLTSKGDIDITKPSETDEESFLNKNLDEIMYFFEVTPYNVVIIEDLDRSRNPEIFIKLREINELLNKSEQIKQRKNGAVKFIYALKDEMFKDEERTKFFDFIIPVIPIINRSNSYTIISEKFPSYLKNKEFQMLLKEISQYIEDMRLLKNIVNEFKIYDDKINSKIDRKKVLSMIVYKNMFPSDFSHLHQNKGVLCNIFDRKNKFIQLGIKDTNEKISELEVKISELENKVDWLDDLTDLRAIYIQKIIMQYKLNHDAWVQDKEGNRFVVTDGVKDKNIFNLIRQSKNISHTVPISNGSYYHNHSKEERLSFDFTQIGEDYDERKSIIEGKYESEIEELKNQISTLKDKKRAIQDSNVEGLVQLFSVVNDSFIKISAELLDKKTEESNHNVLLFRYFIRNGYIDENHLETVSHFHESDEVGLSKRDYEVLLQIRDKRLLPFTQPIQKAKEIIRELHPKDFKNLSVLNFDLVDELLTNKADAYSDQIKYFSRLISKEDEEIALFIEEYFEFTRHKDLFIIFLLKEKPNLITFIQNNKKLSERNKNEYLAEILKSCEMGDIPKLNENNVLKDLLENKSDFIEFEENYELLRSKTIAILKELDIKFETLTGLDKHNELAQYIYTSNHYKLTPSMIESIISVFYEDKFVNESKDGLDTAHLTTIRKLDIKPLVEYINNDIETYVNNCFLAIDRNTKESETIVVKLLNNDALDEAICQEILVKEEVKITDIRKVEYAPLWSFMLDNNCVTPNWDNLLAFYEEFEWKEPKKDE